MTDAGWAERKAARKWKTPELQRIYAAALKAEHARSVHIVKAEFKRVKRSQQTKRVKAMLKRMGY